MSTRIEELLKAIKKKSHDSALVTSTANFYYLSNYYTDPHERVIAVYVSENIDPIIIVPEMEREDARNAGWTETIISYHDHENPWQLLKEHLQRQEKMPETIAIEHSHLTLERYNQLTNQFPDQQFVDLGNTLADIRVIKSKKEYTLLKQAAHFADAAIEAGVSAIKEGVTELEIIATIEYEMKKQ